MTEEQAVAYGKQVLAEHRLTGWLIVVRPGVLARNGACGGATVYGQRTILLRTRDVLGHSDEEVRQLIAHEVAHALNGSWAPAHGREWAAIAIRLGVGYPFITQARLRAFERSQRRSQR